LGISKPLPNAANSSSAFDSDLWCEQFREIDCAAQPDSCPPCAGTGDLNVHRTNIGGWSGAALRLESGVRVLDLGSCSEEMLCTWARDHGVIGTGIDMCRLFTDQTKLRAEELGVADRVSFIHGDAAGYIADENVDVASCVGATWIGGGVAGTIELLVRSLRTGGIILIGEPYWRQLP